MNPLAISLSRSPELFPFDIDLLTDQAILLRLTEVDYRGASFLDARILQPQALRRAVSWPQLEEAVVASGLEEKADYIFHIGHVGSTLLSRLLGAHTGIFALREPTILRTLAQTRAEPDARTLHSTEQEFDRRLGTVLKLLSRTFRPEQGALVKTTSFVSELATQILARPSQPKAMFMFVPAETYLASILGAPNSPQEAWFLSESRLKRLHARIGEERWSVRSLTDGEMVAMSWICEMTTLAKAADAAADRVLWLNFDSFLNDPAQSLAVAFHHLGIEATRPEIDSILSGPEMRRYAKAPEHSYDANLRCDILKQARRDHAAEISRGRSWLERTRTIAPYIESLEPLMA